MAFDFISATRLPTELAPSQEALEKLYVFILNNEPKPPLLGWPLSMLESDVRAFSRTLLTPDKRVAWLQVDRNPDTNNALNPSIMLIDPPINQHERELLPREDYEMAVLPFGRLAIARFNAPAMTGLEVGVLQDMLDHSRPYDPARELLI